MLPVLRKSESNLWSHTITERKLASYHNSDTKFLYCGTVVLAEKLIKNFNSYLKEIAFFFTFLSLTMRKIQHPSLILGRMY